MVESYANRVQSVTELSRSIRGVLETQFPFVAVMGEVSNLRRPQSGHCYFTLKDAGAQIRAVLFKMQQRYLAALPTDGQQVVCRGRISVYEPRGEYQLIVDFLEPQGAGSLQLAFEALKQRLAAEGLFAPERKRRLPFLPQRIALVTSPRGAAVFDFLKTAAKRFAGIPIEILPVPVQGEGAAAEIAAALALLNRRATAEVIVLCRGGGSLEDLWPFNEEVVARAIAASEIPVVSAVGHEIDFTIADLAADLRAPTPTAAAAAVMPDRAELRERTATLSRRMGAAVRRQLSSHRERLAMQRRMLGDPSFLLAHFLLRLDHAQSGMLHAAHDRIRHLGQRLDRLQARLAEQSPGRRLAGHRHRLAALVRELNWRMERLLERKEGEVRQAAALLAAVSPRAVLARGYAIARSVPTGAVIRDSSQVRPGDALTLELHRGRLDCLVSGVASDRDEEDQ